MISNYFRQYNTILHNSLNFSKNVILKSLIIAFAEQNILQRHVILHPGFFSGLISILIHLIGEESQINDLDASIRGIKLSLLCKHPDFPALRVGELDHYCYIHFKLLKCSIVMNSQLITGDSIPDINSIDQDDNIFDISSLIGHKNIVVYFYPKDETPGCIAEACAFRDAVEDFMVYDCEIIGISSDSVEDHKRFKNHYQLPFTLLSDTDNSIRNTFGVPKTLFGLLPGRSTYVANKQGIIVSVFHNQFLAKKHIARALAALKMSVL